MSEFTEVEVAEVTGKALDWATGVAVGKKMVVRKATGQDSGDLRVWESIGDLGGVSWFAPSSNWMHGGPLIDQYVGALSGQNNVRDYAIACPKGTCVVSYGDTLLMAACRAIVSSRLGAKVRVPAILLEDAS